MKHSIPIIWKLIPVFLLLSLTVSGQLAERIDSLASAYASKGFNGNVLYSINDSIIFTGNYGYSDFLTHKRLKDSTSFELASCSKQFTALGIVQLVENGRLSYETKIHEIIKGFPYRNITVEQVLRHQSGLPDYQKLLSSKKLWDRKNKATNEDVIKVLNNANVELHFEPGSQYEYNNTGYVILASVIAQVSGQSYKDYIEQHIFKPSGMLSSRVYALGEQSSSTENVALGYTYNHRRNVYQKAEDDKNHRHLRWMNDIVGDRGVYASILDLEKWKRAIRYNLLITAHSKKKMMSADSISTKYGFGWAIYDTDSKGKWVYHNGSWSGYKTMTLYLPKSNELLIILSNNRFVATYKNFEEDLYQLIQ
ncbi:MAG: serine hydrolase domain-containing protein [Maribacter sp.]|uniref:serine hydrolase domain-containing protein n=1 Tax=Maribacter sp. TaxID=1897614 RepID=UPI0032980B26